MISLVRLPVCFDRSCSDRSESVVAVEFVFYFEQRAVDISAAVAGAAPAAIELNAGEVPVRASEVLWHQFAEGCLDRECPTFWNLASL